FSPDDSRFAYGSRSGTIYLHDTQTRKLLWSHKGHSTTTAQGLPAQGLVFSSDGKRLYSAWGAQEPVADPLAESAIRVWEVSTGKLAGELREHTGLVTSLALSRKGDRLLSGSGRNLRGDGDYHVRLWDTDSGKVVKRFEGHVRDVLGVAFSPDGKQGVS